MHNVMIDIETLSTSKNAVILSLGAVFFDLATGELGSSFYYTIKINSCIEYGLHVDPNTIEWWKKQSEEARKVLNDPDAEDLDQILHDFSDWISINTPDGKYIELWGNGPSFDCAILANAYSACGITPPWQYNKERCVRTMVELGRLVLSIDPKTTLELKGTSHNALDDASHQAKYVSAIFQALNAKAGEWWLT